MIFKMDKGMQALKWLNRRYHLVTNNLSVDESLAGGWSEIKSRHVFFFCDFLEREVIMQEHELLIKKPKISS